MALSPQAVPPAVLDVLRGLRERGHEAFVVGGCVRDLLRGQTPKDWDVTTSARPEEVQASFKKVIPTGIQHGTVTVLSRGTHVEVTTFRSEGAYLDGRRPESVTFERDVTLDLARRDFTMNAMAYDPVGDHLVDPFGGQDDLRAGLIRCVGDASARFGEDGLRPMRAVRFAAVLGFTLDPATHAAIPPTLPVFAKVSVERVREELVKLLLSTRPGLGLGLLEETGLLGAFLPELQRAGADELARVRAALDASPRDEEVRLALLLADARGAAKDLCLRLKLPNKVVGRVALLCAHKDLAVHHDATDAGLRRLLAKVGLEPLEQLAQVSLARTRARAPEALPRLEAVLERLHVQAAARPPLTSRELALNGGDIMRILGVGPGKAVGDATRMLLDAVLDDPGKNTRETLEGLLRAWSPA